MCELCTIETMQRSGQCPNCRAAVARLVVVPVNVTLHQPTRPEEVDVSGELASDATTSPLATATITLQLMRKNGQFGLGVRPDNYVMEVDEGSGAHEAGMRPGDWIVSVSNVAVATYADTLPLLTAVWECIPTPVVVRYVVADHPDRRAPYHADHPDRRAPPVVVVQGTPTGPLAVPLDQPLQPRRLQTHVDEPEPDGSTFESVQTFLQAMLQSADEDVAEAARNALRAHRSEAPAAARPPPSADTEVAQAARAALASQAGANRGQRGFAPQGMRRTTTHVTIPEGTRHIGEQAFLGCTSLALTRLPDGLTSIGNDAFHRCTSLALTSLPDGLLSIGDRAFYGCTSLALTRLPDGLLSIGQHAFYGCTSLALTRLPDGLTIGYRAFEGCTGISRSTLKKSDGRRLSRREAAKIGLPACECCMQ